MWNPSNIIEWQRMCSKLALFDCVKTFFEKMEKDDEVLAKLFASAWKADGEDQHSA